MRRKVFVWVFLIGISLLYSCNNLGKLNEASKVIAENRIEQQNDGTISLKLDKAECYHDMVDPSSNTAEWNVVVSKSGRFNVWLTSATKDTTKLQYDNSVMLSVMDKRLETHPVCDRIIQNASEVSWPYFRADSFMGSLYIQDTGIYNFQIISDKIIPSDYKANKSPADENTKLLSVVLTPTAR